MPEYLIRRTDGKWFDLHASQYADALRPTTFHSERVDGWGEWRIRCEGVEISFSYEDAGIQVSIEGDLPGDVADRIAEEVCQNIERVTGQRGRVVRL